jgi:hypothetical protein
VWRGSGDLCRDLLIRVIEGPLEESLPREALLACHGVEMSAFMAVKSRVGVPVTGNVFREI